MASEDLESQILSIHSKSDSLNISDDLEHKIQQIVELAKASFKIIKASRKGRVVKSRQSKKQPRRKGEKKKSKVKKSLSSKSSKSKKPTHVIVPYQDAILSKKADLSEGLIDGLPSYHDNDHHSDFEQREPTLENKLKETSSRQSRYEARQNMKDLQFESKHRNQQDKEIMNTIHQTLIQLSDFMKPKYSEDSLIQRIITYFQQFPIPSSSTESVELADYILWKNNFNKLFVDDNLKDSASNQDSNKTLVLITSTNQEVSQDRETTRREFNSESDEKKPSHRRSTKSSCAKKKRRLGLFSEKLLNQSRNDKTSEDTSFGFSKIVD
jgi:hypothetical protein